MGLPTLAFAPRNVAPSWRCFCMKALLNNMNTEVLAGVLQWLPTVRIILLDLVIIGAFYTFFLQLWAI